MVIECVSCSGEGCKYCDNTGEFRVIGCPNKFCSDMVPAIGLIELFNRGLPPVSGGVLDQSAWFIEAVQRLKLEEQLAKAD